MIPALSPERGPHPGGDRAGAEAGADPVEPGGAEGGAAQGTLSRDPAGLGALLAAQVDSTDNLAGIYARTANQQLDTARATLAELKRLASTLEALIARQTAA
jgi:hypothetical protein